MKVIKDMMGNMVRPGDLVACSSLRYRSAELKFGVVSDIDDTLITVTRITKNYGGKFSHRKTKCYGKDIIVLRWDTLREESEYCEHLNKVKLLVMKQ